MNVIRSMVIAMAMYSKIPVPNVKWEEASMRYIFCFFPLVGVIIAGLEIGWWYLCQVTALGDMLYATVAAVIPFLITGGIHMDGYMDTMDAKHSYQPKEKRLEILKDPHLGAFAVITALVYVLLYVGFVSEVNTIRGCLLYSISFVISRACSSFTFVLFPSAKKEGLFYTFQIAAKKKAIAITQGIVLTICLLIGCAIHLWCGLAILLGTLLTFFYYKRMSEKMFGGVTGDLAGYFLQLIELIILMLVVVLVRG